MVTNALWGWLQQCEQSNRQHRGKPIWAAELWHDVAAGLGNLPVKVCHVDAHVHKSQSSEEHQNNQQVDIAAKIKVAQVGLDWQHFGCKLQFQEGFGVSCSWFRQVVLASAAARAAASFSASCCGGTATCWDRHVVVLHCVSIAL